MACTTTWTVVGMTCAHCVAAVTEQVSALPGVRGVDVELVDGGASLVRVHADEPPAEDAVRAAVDEAGYELNGSAR